MAVLGRLLLGSAERLDLPDLLSIDSFAAADFKYLIQSFIGADKPFILKGFEVIQPQDSIGTESVSIAVADSVAYYPSSGAGSFYYGLPEGTTGTEPLVPELRKNAINYVYLTLTTFDSARDSRAFWDPDQNGGDGGEFSQDVNTETVLSVEINVSVSTFPENVIPIAKIKVGPSVIESIQDCRDLMFRLGTGGVNPDPFNNFNFREDPSADYARSEPSTIMTSPLDANPFEGGDKNIFTLREWMSVVMTRIKELSGDTYWYSEEGTGVSPNTSDTWHDTLGSTLVSKGEFSHDELVGGRVTWSEDVRYNNLTDSRSIIIRHSTIDIPNDNVAYIKLIRDKELNTTNTAVTWLNGSNTVDGVVGSFENLTKGDWIKRKSDGHPLYLRAEEFYASTGLAGGTTSPALAQSVRLNKPYAGTSGSEIGDYTKGEYLQTDIQTDKRDEPSIHDLGGDFYWLSYRNDVLLGLESIVPTQLTIDITQADSIKARVTSAAHGLIDQDRITITTGGYAGTYQVEVEDANNFFINTSVTGDEFGQTAFYAIVESRAVKTDYNYELESANHTAQANQRVFIENTNSLYDGSYLVNPRSDTTFQIAYDALTPDPGPLDTENIRVIKVNVRTEFGVVKVIQGESVDIGDIDTQNILSYIGMDSLSQTAPIYSTPNGYNTLDGYHNYNSEINDDLTIRVSKLTAMMADRVQERGFSLRGRINITSVTNGLNQDITANGLLTLHKPSSPEQAINLTVSLPANSVAVADIDRDGNASIALTVESIGSASLLSENKIIMFYRFNDETIYTWEDHAIKPSGHYNFGLPEDSSNRNIVVYNPGQIKLDPPSGLLYLKVDEAVEKTRITVSDGATTPQSSWFTFNAALDTTEYYVWYDIDTAGVDPLIAGKTGIAVPISSSDSANAVALATEAAISVAAAADITTSVNNNSVEITNLLIGTATDALDLGGTNFDIDILCNGNDPDIELIIPGSIGKNIIDVDVINSLGTLIIPNGAAAWVRVNRYTAKTFNTVLTSDTPDTEINGAIYITNIQDIPTDQDVFVLWTRIQDSMIESNKAQRPDGNVYEEYLDVVPGVPVNEYEITGPVVSGTELQLPPDSRDDNRIQEYVVGSGQLKLFLRGQFLRNGVDWEEVGITGCLSSRIKLLQHMELDDSLFFRIDSLGAVYFASDGASPTSLQDAYDGGRFINVVTGQPIVITGASGKLMSIQGDLDVTGVIDPKGITFDLQSATPFISQSGIWFNNSDEMVLETIAANSAITTNAGNLILKSSSGTVQTAAIFELGNYLDMNGQLLTDLTGPVILGANLSLNDNLLLGGSGDITLGDNINVNSKHIVDGNTLLLHTSGTSNFFAGLNSGNLTSSGNNNTGLGSNTFTNMTSGSSNSALGYNALSEVTIGSANTAVGSGAIGSLHNGVGNSAFGSNALSSANNTTNNTALGRSSMELLLSGNDNAAVGNRSLLYETSGSSNTAIGSSALETQNGADNNTALGYKAGQALTSGELSIFIGASADTNDPSADNQIAIGYGARVDSANKIRIGNDDLKTVELAPNAVIQTATSNLNLNAVAGSLNLNALTDITITSALISLIGPVETSTTLSVGGVLNMNNFKITGLATPTLGTDAATLQEVIDLETTINNEFLRLDGTNPMGATLNMNNFKITGLATPTSGTDAATFQEVVNLETTINNEFLRLDGTNPMEATLNMDSFKITNLATPTSGADAVNKNYADLHVKLDGSVAMSGNLDMDNTARIVNLLDPINPQDAVTKSFVEGPGILKATYVQLLNNTPTLLPAGSIIAVSAGFAGQCFLADATTQIDSEGTVGVVIADTPSGSIATVQVAGESVVPVVNTGLLTIGKRVYLDTIAGSATSSAPTISGSTVFFLGIATDIDKIIIQPSFIYVNE